MSETTEPMLETDLLHLVLEKLKEGGPLTVSALLGKQTTIKKDVLGLSKKAPKKAVEEALEHRLEEMVKAGQLHRLQPTAKKSKPAYFTETAESLGRSALRAVIASQGPISAPDAKKDKSLTTVKKFLTSARQDQLLRELVEEGTLYEWPKQGKKISKVRFSVHRADAREYLDSALEKFRKELKTLAATLGPAGIRFEDLLSASRLALVETQVVSRGVDETIEKPEVQPPPVVVDDLSDVLLDLMEELEPAARNGAAVPIAMLRHELDLQNLDKATFDSQVLRLAEQGILDLHRYDHPAGLSQAGRDDLVPDGQGGYFVAVARRV